LQKLVIVAMKSLLIWLQSIKRTITRAWLSITPRSYADGRHDRNTVCGDTMDSYPCSPCLDSKPRRNCPKLG